MGLNLSIEECREALNEQNAVLARARDAFLLKEAERKYFEANLIKKADGKSHAERLVNAQATDAWLTFHKDLARLESLFEFEKLKYDILDKGWLEKYSANKTDGRTMKRLA
jgi:hypothetical protein